MKTKDITIGIKSVEEGLKEFAAVVDAARQGHMARRAKTGVYFTNLETMRAVLTPKRLELLHLIREMRPQSIYELARIAKRDLKNVQDDVALLARIELVSLRRAKALRNRVIPKVDYDSMRLHIPVI